MKGPCAMTDRRWDHRIVWASASPPPFQRASSLSPCPRQSSQDNIWDRMRSGLSRCKWCALNTLDNHGVANFELGEWSKRVHPVSLDAHDIDKVVKRFVGLGRAKPACSHRRSVTSSPVQEGGNIAFSPPSPPPPSSPASPPTKAPITPPIPPPVPLSVPGLT